MTIFKYFFPRFWDIGLVGKIMCSVGNAEHIYLFFFLPASGNYWSAVINHLFNYKNKKKFPGNSLTLCVSYHLS